MCWCANKPLHCYVHYPKHISLVPLNLERKCGGYAILTFEPTRCGRSCRVHTSSKKECEYAKNALLWKSFNSIRSMKRQKCTCPQRNRHWELWDTGLCECCIEPNSVSFIADEGQALALTLTTCHQRGLNTGMDHNDANKEEVLLMSRTHTRVKTHPDYNI